METPLKLDYETCAKKPEVQAATASWSLWFTMSQDSPAFFILIFAGYFVDKFGHKAALKTSMVSCISLSLIYFMATVFEFPLHIFLVVYAIGGITGGMSLSSMTTSAYIAATTTPSERTKYFMLQQCALSISLAIGPVFGGYVAKEFGFRVIFGIMLLSSLLLGGYIILIFPDSVNGSSIDCDDNEDASSLRKVFQESVSTTATTILFLFSHRTSRSIMFIFVAYAISGSASEPMFIMYPSKAFGWDSLDIGQFLSFVSIQRILLLTFGLPVIEQIFRHGGDKLGGEIRLLRFALLTGSVGTACFGFARNASEFWLSTSIVSLATFASPTAKSILSTIVPVYMQGRLFSSLGMFLSATMLTGSISMNKFYQATVKQAPQAIFFVASSLDLVAFISGLFGIRKDGVQQMRDDSRSTEENFSCSNSPTEETALLA
ncbi:hypothetical protein HK100_003456 [Physocladia obscura]|uniref:Major facilitator superfamily (MFS) profile domain-containing protein n=1 Tax=Physocladia obscura TaxID=109957 RepID=A0AAD5STZ5_9FUNG|nr:hypothetical protein HK100_003456 [Physocladia obscura]